LSPGTKQPLMPISVSMAGSLYNVTHVPGDNSASPLSALQSRLGLKYACRTTVRSSLAPTLPNVFESGFTALPRHQYISWLPFAFWPVSVITLPGSSHHLTLSRTRSLILRTFEHSGQDRINSNFTEANYGKYTCMRQRYDAD
jgi:hypothetical protein